MNIILFVFIELPLINLLFHYISNKKKLVFWKYFQLYSFASSIFSVAKLKPSNPRILFNCYFISDKFCLNFFKSIQIITYHIQTTKKKQQIEMERNQTHLNVSLWNASYNKMCSILCMRSKTKVDKWRLNAMNNYSEKDRKVGRNEVKIHWRYVLSC